jgi:hypothetical protein
MLQWGIFERANIEKLQIRLQKGKEIILMVQGQAAMIQEEQNRDTVNGKISALMDAEADAVSRLEKRLEGLEEKADKQLERIDQVIYDVGNVASAIVPFASIAAGLPESLSKIYSDQRALRVLLCDFNPYAQSSALVEDSLGWTIQIPLELVTSWNTFHSILLDKFASRPGLQLVKNHRYVFRDDLTGSELQQIGPLSSVLRPGQKINMCMVFFASTDLTNVCPRCSKTTLQMNSNDLKCTDARCGMEIQRIEEITDEDQLRSLSRKLTSMEVSAPEDHEDVDNKSTVDELPESLPLSLEDNPGVFKRVRYITRWEHRLESRGRLKWRGDKYSIWYALGKEATAIRKSLPRNSLLKGIRPKRPGPDQPAPSFNQMVAVHLQFIGPSIEQSKLMIGVFSMSKKRRNKYVRQLKGIEWVKNNPSVIVVGHCSTLFIESAKRSYQQKAREAGFTIDSSRLT